MQASEMIDWTLAALAGAALGFVFFRALLLTVERLVTSPRPGVLMLASLMLRSAIVLGGFYAIARLAGLGGLVAGLAGFVVVRTAMIRRVRRAAPLADRQRADRLRADRESADRELADRNGAEP